MRAYWICLKASFFQRAFYRDPLSLTRAFRVKHVSRLVSQILEKHYSIYPVLLNIHPFKGLGQKWVVSRHINVSTTKHRKKIILGKVNKSYIYITYASLGQGLLPNKFRSNLFIFLAVLRVKSRASHLLDKHSTTKPDFQLSSQILFKNKTIKNNFVNFWILNKGIVGLNFLFVIFHLSLQTRLKVKGNQHLLKICYLPVLPLEYFI